MDDLLQEFYLDTSSILKDLELILENLEKNPSDYHLLEKFGQQIDRIMGASKSLGYVSIGEITESCKTISYKSSQAKNVELVTIVVAILFDALEAISELCESLFTKGNEELNPSTKKMIYSRLNFINNKLSHIQRSSVAINDKDLLELSDNFHKIGQTKEK
jgi:chemotaxis protein histidine kinase CheA